MIYYENADVLNILNEINNFLEREEYFEASEYIKTKRREIDKEVDPVSDYMDKLIQDIK